MADISIPSSYESYRVNIDDVVQSVSGGVLVTCALSLVFWGAYDLIIINPFISTIVGAASIMFLVMGNVIRSSRLNNRPPGVSMPQS